MPQSPGTYLQTAPSSKSCTNLRTRYEASPAFLLHGKWFNQPVNPSQPCSAPGYKACRQAPSFVCSRSLSWGLVRPYLQLADCLEHRNALDMFAMAMPDPAQTHAQRPSCAGAGRWLPLCIVCPAKAPVICMPGTAVCAMTCKGPRSCPAQLPSSCTSWHPLLLQC